MNKRRKLIVALGAGALAAPISVFAQQQGKVWRVGFLSSESAISYAHRVDALRAGLRDLDYIECKNLAIEWRSAEGNYDRLPDLAAELVRLNPDVLVAMGIKAALAAKRTTIMIPIVVPGTSDAVASGLVTSFSRPGGNVTGSSFFGPEIMAKRLELCKEVIPRIIKVAVVQNPVNASFAAILQAMEKTAKTLKLSLQPFAVRTPNEFDSVFATIATKHVDLIAIQEDTMFNAHRKRVADLALTKRLPSAGNIEFADAGGLIGYGANNIEMYRRSAYFVDKILKGTKPADIPVEQATKFELVVNLKTAKALGIKIPNSIWVRADRVIE